MENIVAVEKPPLGLHFNVSSGLKSVLGADLITNDEVAIFELVKNSFDAGSSLVEIFFREDEIIISDNGSGMSFSDLDKKWLFVAYSSKKGVSRSNDFREEIAERRHYAGSKGIGRFSSDRLGENIEIQTRSKSETGGKIHRLLVNWALFDADLQKKFHQIGVKYNEVSDFSLPEGLARHSHGTVVRIFSLRKKWDRDLILDLKSSLAKLINPFGSEADGFKISLIAPNEEPSDALAINTAAKKGEELSPNKVVNGEVGNFIFSNLQEKTTFIDVSIDQTGKFIESSLIDRGELIYRIREPNEYPLLENSGFKCRTFFLNQSAKITFAKRMGVPSVQFGSVFLFRNGFRVFPIGEEGDDWYGMDRRKQQGYARFLGTRDLIGRIDVAGDDINFSEASSRNAGLIETQATIQLKKCFQEHCLKRLERYVVPVTFVDKEDKNTSDVSRLLTDPGKARVANSVARLIDNKDVELLDYSKRLIGILDERSTQFESSLGSLRAIAEKTQDRTLFQNVEDAEKKFNELRRSEAAAREQADAERSAKEAAERRAVEAETLSIKTTEQLEEEKKRNLFLASIATLDTDTIINLHHQVTMYAVDINQQIENLLVRCADHAQIPRGEILDALERISLLNKKVMGVSKFATKANFRLESEHIKADIGNYIEQYINGIAKDFLFGPTKVDVSSDGKPTTHKFKPIDIAVVIDNLIANAKKAKATKISFSISHPNKDAVNILVRDNGKGFPLQLDDLNRVFEKGYTTTDGSGLGLYHIRLVLGEMKGTIEANRGTPNGAEFHIRIAL